MLLSRTEQQKERAAYEDKLIEWVTQAKSPPSRVRFYGSMLLLCNLPSKFCLRRSREQIVRGASLCYEVMIEWAHEVREANNFHKDFGNLMKLWKSLAVPYAFYTAFSIDQNYASASDQILGHEGSTVP